MFYVYCQALIEARNWSITGLQRIAFILNGQTECWIFIWKNKTCSRTIYILKRKEKRKERKHRKHACIHLHHSEYSAGS